MRLYYRYIYHEWIGKEKVWWEITVIEKNGVLPYNPYPPSKEWMMDGEDMEPPILKKRFFYENNGIDLRLNTKVEFINWKDKTLKTDLDGEISYDYLVIATGSKLRKVKLPGDDAQGIFCLLQFHSPISLKIEKMLKSC